MLDRRYDVDWLRNLAFMLLILYHIGMFYVAEWGWHIKSEQQSEFLQNLMLWSNQWRMSLLFFVSGMTLALIEAKYSSLQLFKTRFMRLFIPLLFGMYVIVPPQLYFELVANGQMSMGYGSFWLEYVQPYPSILPDKQSSIGLLTWNHLWYLVYLWVYTLMYLVLRPLLKAQIIKKALLNMHNCLLLALMLTTLLTVWYTMRLDFPSTHALLDDWYNHGKYFSVFLFGYLFVMQKTLWQWLIDHKLWPLLIGCVTYAFILLDKHGAFPWLAEAFVQSEWVKLAYGAIAVINLWSWLLTMVAFAGRYLNRPSSTLNTFNQAVLPSYILHQTVIILFAVMLTRWQLPIALESALLVVLTCLGCYVGFQIIRRVALFRLLFGMKVNATPTAGS